jgi:cysteine desulfurase
MFNLKNLSTRLKAGRQVYLDYASATPVSAAAVRAMRAAERLVGNPGAIHAEGVKAKKCLEEARETIARELACKAREVIFTSGLTESNDLAILGVARHLMLLNKEDDVEGTHWVVSAIEHDAVLQSFAEIERLDGEITHVYPDKNGIISPETVANVVRENTVMVSVGWANNEIGVVQPLRDISRAVLAKNPKVLIHSDAGQAPLYIAPQVHTLGVDLLALGSNKLYGPHGAGALYISNRVQATNILHGGKQERGLRPGTENVALAAGFAAALAETSKRRDAEKKRLKKLRDNFASEIVARIPDAVVNGDPDRTLPHMLNISIPNIDAEYVTLALSQKGVSISTKSACREGEESQSHVVAALSQEEWRAQNSLRFSLGRETVARDLAKAAKLLCSEIFKHQASNRK